MIVIDVLLAANLVVFAVCAWRAPGRSRRPGIDALLAEAKVVPIPVRSDVASCSNIVPFPSQLQRARSLHPSMSGRP